MKEKSMDFLVLLKYQKASLNDSDKKGGRAKVLKVLTKDVRTKGQVIL